MRKHVLAMVLMWAAVVGGGCESGDKPQEKIKRTAPVVTRGGRTDVTINTGLFTDERNPTQQAGRGEPSLDDAARPAAWVYIDGKAGRYVEEDGRPRAQWVIDEPVSNAPTFRVAVYEPLMGTPKSFRCVVQMREPEEGTSAMYAYKAEDGSFRIGRDYSLVKPGDEFTVRNHLTGDVVTEVPRLLPGDYLIAAGVRNDETGSDALAITFFTVGK